MNSIQLSPPEEQSQPADDGRRTIDDGLDVRDLRKTFPSPSGETIEVLRGVSLSVSAGEMVAITGASGAGKSTLLHLLGGLEAADSGTIQLGQLAITGARASVLSRLRNHQIGFVFQFHYLVADLDAVENVALPLMIRRLGSGESLRRATETLRGIGLGNRLDHRIGQLSGGEQQRVAVARALIAEPKLVLADEPTGNLDASIGDEIGAALVSYCRRQRAVVVVATHNERLARLCDRVLLLKDGEISSTDFRSVRVE
jgi:lipoprotein-releasing system ATP-binding protein